MIIPPSEQSVLVVVDVQGKLAQCMADREALFRRLQVLIQAIRCLEIPVLWCQQAPHALGPTIPEIAQHLEGLEPVDKTEFSCWKNEGFRQRLVDLSRSKVLLCGIETHICIYQTAIDLGMHGYNVEVLVDAVSSRTQEDKQVALRRMNLAGITLSTIEMTLFSLIGSARHPHFRSIARLVK
ncbi:hydrolase [Planctomycetota bacterium]